MRSQATSPPLTVTVLAALWVTVGRCDVTEAPGCDSGKLYLDRDMPQDAVNWDCPVSAWPESSQRLPSIDTVFDPEPARQICMDQSISYNHSIPSSGAYRPVRAESGEYLYCPPHRWLNNLHHGATVLLFHPCAPLHERLLLSALARSCVPHYIFTPHPELSKHTPLALVSWGRTLELSSVASSDVCDWLETTTSTGQKFVGVSRSRKYNLLLTWSAEQQQARQAQQTKESLRRCCEQTISSLLSGAMASSSKEQSLKAFQERDGSRQVRAAVRGKQDTEDHEDTTTHESNRTTLSGTGDVLRHSSTLGSASPGNRTLSELPGPREAPSQPDIDNTNQGLAASPKAHLGSNVTEVALRAGSVGLGTAGSLKNRLTLHTAAGQPSHQHAALRKTQPSAGLDVVSSNTLTPHSKDEGTDSAEHIIKKEHSDGMMKDNEVVDVQERELVLELTHSDIHSGHRSEKTVPVSKSQAESPSHPQLHPNPQLVSYLPGSHECASCKAGERCDCDKDSGAAAPAAAVNKGLPRTPRTDEAVWAAAALGFLLVLLTLSVLHTRLYRHWRTTPSLYWHDPQQDYDSVADVIRRRLRIAKRRRKRGRRQECVLLPSSSSSDELS